jgi:YVTN family beta-propeller protein
VNKRAYVTNRYSDSDAATNDHVFVFNIDESSADFMTFTEITVGPNPFGIACCYPADRMWIAEDGNDNSYVSQYIDRGDLSVGDVNLLVPLDTGGEFTQNETTDLVILGNQAFYSRTRGGVVVINMDQAGVAGAQPVDYWIQDVNSPRGIATDGSYIYVATEENLGDGWRGYLEVLDPSSLVPLTDNTEAVVLDKDDDNLLVAEIELNEKRDPQEVLITNDYAFVSASWNDDNYVHVINRADFTWNSQIATGDSPFAMALYAPGGVEKYVYVVNQISNTIQVIDIATLAIVATYP